MSGSISFPVVVTSAGAVPTSPTDIYNTLIQTVASTNPGYTAELPGSLIDDVVGTDVAAIAQIDQARVDAINSITPYAANVFVLQQQGAMLGVPLGQGSTTSVYLVFSSPDIGYPVPQGLVVSDGTYQYAVQESAIIQSGGTSALVYALALQQGSWSVPANTVNVIQTSIPSTVTLTVTNPNAGTPGTAAQQPQDYRADVIQALSAVTVGLTTTLKTALRNVSGVQARLVSVRAVGTLFEVIVGGGDPYAVANAIFNSVGNPLVLTGSTLSVLGITQANPGIVTTNLNHGFSTGQVISISGVVGMTAINGVNLTITVLSATTFSVGVNTTGYGAYVSGGVVLPNLRNVTVSINDYPDTYTIPFVLPPQQAVTIALTWNTISPNFVSAAAVAQLGSAALISYVNSVPVGQPMNLFELQSAFQIAVAALIPTSLLTRMVFAVSINGIGVSPISGTGEIVGDPESYFYASATSMTINQG